MDRITAKCSNHSAKPFLFGAALSRKRDPFYSQDWLKKSKIGWKRTGLAGKKQLGYR
jgi:hypothetical protein